MTETLSGRGELTGRYEALAAAGDVTRDPSQLALLKRLDRLNGELAERRLARKDSSLGWLFGGKARAPLKGLYVWGDVGRGKTFVMDEFFAVAAPARKRRAHFHEFMADVHDRIHALREAAKAGNGKAGDPIVPVAGQIAEETRLLCLDEFMVTDIADAMILSRLFGELFARGLVLVATSNTAPDDLYRDGLNRALFHPFIEILKRHVDVVALNGTVDYRLRNLAEAPIYVTPLGPPARAALDAAWKRLAGGHGSPAVLEVKGRRLAVPEAGRGVARFPFAALCEALWENGYVVDTLETATDWSNVDNLLNRIEASLRDGLAAEGERV
ncbi:MAG: AFG1 family ATPase, partial [Rhizobiales bacterium]|nr:AFG1 family ATPase [Hyphomicrobiales bacterium]